MSMLVTCDIKDTKTQKSKLAGMRRRAVNIVRDTDQHVRFVFLKATQDGNGSPAMTLRDAIPSMPRVGGFSRKALDDFMLKHAGFAWDNAKKVYKKDKTATVQPLPVAEAQTPHCRFWEFEKDAAEKPTAIDQVREYLTKRVNKVSKEEVLAIIENLYADAE